MEEGTYTSAEAIAEFIRHGLSSSRLYRRVKEGKIAKYLPGDRQRGATYSKADVDRICREEGRREGRTSSIAEAHWRNRGTPPAEIATEPLVDVVGQDDLAYVYLMESEQLGFDQAVYPNVVWSWQSKNDHLYWLLSNPENRKEVWAVLGILPLRYELITRLLQKEISPKDIRPDDVLTSFEPGQECSYYIASAATIPSRRGFITHLMQRVLSYWCEQAPKICVDRVYALSRETVEDDPVLHLAKEYFFSPLYERFGGQGHIAWELRFDLHNPSPIVQNFQRCLQNPEKKEENTMVAVLPKIKQTVIKTRKRRLPTTSRILAGAKSEARMPFRLVRSDEDVWSIVRIGNAIFGASDVDNEGLVGLFKSWLAQNNEIFHVLEDDDGQVVGFASLLPLTRDKIDETVRSQIRITGVKPEDILPFEPGRPVDMFVHVLGADPALQGEPKRTAGKWLIMGVMEMFHDFGERGIEVRSIHARSDTPDGINTSIGLGFQEVEAPPGVTKRVFVLDVSQSNQAFLIDYMKALEEYRTKHAVNSNAS